MKDIYITVDLDNRVTGYGTTRSSDKDIEITVDDTHEVLKNPFVFTYVDGQLTKDNAYQQQLSHEEELIKNIPTAEEEIASIWYALMTGSVKDA